MSSTSMSAGSVGATLTGGIQDVSAPLPSLGTEQREDHATHQLRRRDIL